MKLNIAYLPGDGIGPEIGEIAVTALKEICAQYGHELSIAPYAFGGAAIDTAGTPLPDETLQACKAADAVLLTAIGGPKWAGLAETPETGLLKIRKELGTFANIRPVKTHPAVSKASPLKPEILEDVDIVVLRELTGGIYFGKKQRDENQASDECAYTKPEIERITRVAADMARKRSGKLTSLDKANVLQTSKLWREVVTNLMAEEYPDVALEHLYIDAAAMHLLSRPRDFDVIVTENMFGDIITDEASMLSGSLGMLPSASTGEAGKPGIFEPIHGAANDIEGQNLANPFGMVLSTAMMLRIAFDLEEEATILEQAVYTALEQGQTTKDLGGNLGTKECGEALMTILKSQDTAIRKAS